uniref:60S ribosomal protein L21 n=2 Tax=Chrysotila carterae TaxID=13221 RepID=A0A7S4BZ48_CHRCT
MGKGMGARSRGYRSCTRDLFSKKPRDKNYNPPLSTFLRTYKVGDTVDIVCNSAQQKGMPYKFYHGRTGTVWNVTRRGIGVEVNKVHRQRQLVKRIHVRVEHLRPSNSKAGHLARVKSNEEKKKAAKESGVPCATSELKRSPKGPRDGFTLDLGKTFETKVHTLTPVPYVFKPLSKSIA